MPIAEQLVINRRMEILSLTHRLDFASDQEVNDAIITRFGLYEMLYRLPDANALVLHDMINRWSDYFNQLYKTTLYDYNPIENYNMVENGEDHDNGSTSETSGGSDSQTQHSSNSSETSSTQTVTGETKGVSGRNGIDDTSDTPYTDHITDGSRDESLSETMTDGTGTTTGDFTSSGTHTGNIEGSHAKTLTHRLTRVGNIGTMTTQQMIMQERQIIINLISEYVDKFKDCFMITM